MVLLSASILVIGLAHASLFITPPGYSTIVTNLPYPCSPVITTGGSIPSSESGGALLTSLPANGYAIAIAGIALVISIMLVAIIYMISKLFPHLGIQGWISNEYWEIAKSVLLIVIVYALLLFLSNVAVNVTNTPAYAYSSNTYLNNINGLLYSSETYLLTVDSYVAAGWCTIGNVEFGTGLLYNFNVKYYVPIPIPIILAGLKFGVSFNPLSPPLLIAGNDETTGQFSSLIIDIVLLLYYPLSMVVLILIEILPLLVWVGLGFFIPFGIIFRALPFLRGLGGTFFAIGIGLAVMLPALLVVFNYPVTQVMQGIVPIAAAAPSNTCSFGGALLKFACNAFMSIIGNVVRIRTSLGYGFSEFNGIYTVLNALTPYMVFMIAQEILFVLDMIIIYALLDTVATTLGGSLSPLKSGLGGKFKLI